MGARMFELQHDFLPKRGTGSVADDVLNDVEATRAGAMSPLRLRSRSPGTGSLRVLGAMAISAARLRSLACAWLQADGGEHRVIFCLRCCR